jgi:RNA polymerase sigma factor (sigma-70 family)
MNRQPSPDSLGSPEFVPPSGPSLESAFADASEVAASGGLSPDNSEAQPRAQDLEKEEGVADLVARSLSPRDEKTVAQMFARLRGPAHLLRAGDAASLRDHLVMLHTPLVEHCARNFAASGEPLEDLLQEGYVGLIKAVDRFDPTKGVRFSTYACHLISGEVRHYLRDLGKIIHEPGWHSELRQRIARASDGLTQKLGRAARPEDIAESLNVRVETVRDVLRNSQVLAVDSLDADRSEGGEDEDRRSDAGLFHRAAEPQVDDRILLGGALPQLKELEKKAIQLFFFEENSKTEVARKLGISINYAAYLIKQGTAHLRQIIEGDPLDAPATPSEARAAYLLSLIKKHAAVVEAPRRRSRKGVVDDVAASAASAALSEFADFVMVMDEELRRSQRYDQESCLLWLHVANWNRLRARWSEEELRDALDALSDAARGDLRGGDRVGVVPPSLLPNLHLIVVLPHTGEVGRVVQERLGRDLLAPSVFPGAEKMALRSTLAVLPRDGQNADALFEKIGPHLAF